MKSSKLKYLAIGLSGVAGCVMATGAFAQQAQVTQKGGVTIITAPSRSNGIGLDIANAKPMPLPMITTSPGSAADSHAATYPGAPGSVPGNPGTGKMTPTQLFSQSELLNLLGADPDPQSEDDNGGIEPQEFGTAYQPYTTSRVDLPSYPAARSWPYRAAGKLYFTIGSSTFVCSASLIKKGVIVTAAHCVANYGRRQVYANWRFVPALSGGVAPYGSWGSAQALVMTSYFTGSPNLCSPTAPGVVCQDDVAVIRLAPFGGAYPGTRTGWYGYGWNGYGFTPWYGQAQLTQLGYPASHDRGLYMQRTESMGFTGPNYLASNTVIGSRMTGGSSGGPWVVNLGVAATLSTPYGSAANWNVVTGVASWGYSNPAIKQMGASPFLSTNIVPLVSTACAGAGAPACAN